MISSWAQVLVAPNVSEYREPGFTFTYWEIEASLPSLAAWTPRGMARKNLPGWGPA